MKVIVVGGAGLIGGATALLLRSQGHESVIAGRNPPKGGTPLAAIPFLRLDYTDSTLEPSVLSGFDALIFAAGNDVRHKPPTSGDEHWQRANSQAVPRFFALARAAGIKRAVNVGSFYTQAAPHLIETNPYVRSRREAELGVAALASPDFVTMSVNPPLVIGAVEGVHVPMFEAHTKFALGELAPMPEFVPAGGVNFISTRSLSQALANAVMRGNAGASYLVGDENLTFQQYFGAYFEAVGRQPPPVRNEEAPIFPDRSIYFGRGNTLFYEPDAAETAILGYHRNDVIRSIREIVTSYLETRQAH